MVRTLKRFKASALSYRARQPRAEGLVAEGRQPSPQLQVFGGTYVSRNLPTMLPSSDPSGSAILNIFVIAASI